MFASVVLAGALAIGGIGPVRLPPHGKPVANSLRPEAVDCTLNTLTMAFGTYAPLGADMTTPLEVAGSFKVKCTGGTGNYSITANNGVNSASATSTCATATCTRAMLTGASSYVSYDLYSDSGYTTVWNATNPISGSASGTVTIPIYGYIPAGIAETAGSYSDTVTVTVTF